MSSGHARKDTGAVVAVSAAKLIESGVESPPSLQHEAGFRPQTKATCNGLCLN